MFQKSDVQFVCMRNDDWCFRIKQRFQWKVSTFKPCLICFSFDFFLIDLEMFLLFKLWNNAVLDLSTLFWSCKKRPNSWRTNFKLKLSRFNACQPKALILADYILFHRCVQTHARSPKCKVETKCAESFCDCLFFIPSIGSAVTALNFFSNFVFRLPNTPTIKTITPQSNTTTIIIITTVNTSIYGCVGEPCLSIAGRKNQCRPWNRLCSISFLMHCRTRVTGWYFVIRVQFNLRWQQGRIEDRLTPH